MNGKKEHLILDCLKKHKELSTTKIRDYSGLHYDLVKVLLNKLKKDKKVKSRKSKFGTYIYWSLT